MRKKILLFVMVLGLIVLCAEPVFAYDIASCESSIKGALIDEKIPNIVSTIITVIKIVVPVLLVIMGMLDLMKGVTAGKEDEMKKAQGLFIKRLISGALVFLVVTIVQLIISFVADEEDKPNISTCSKCFINGDCTYKTKSDGSCPDPDNMKLSKDKTFCIKVSK